MGRSSGLGPADALCELAFRAVAQLELHGLALFECTEAIPLNLAVVDEHVCVALHPYEPKTLGIIEPLDDT
jgi:hypothetical protein